MPREVRTFQARIGALLNDYGNWLCGSVLPELRAAFNSNPFRYELVVFGRVWSLLVKFRRLIFTNRRLKLVANSSHLTTDDVNSGFISASERCHLAHCVSPGYIDESIVSLASI